MTKKRATARERLVAENAAAIAAHVHQSGRYELVYERTARKAGGFPGIWGECATLGLYLTSVEDEFGGENAYDETRNEWIDTVMLVAGRFMEGDWVRVEVYESDWKQFMRALFT